MFVEHVFFGDDTRLSVWCEGLKAKAYYSAIIRLVVVVERIVARNCFQCCQHANELFL